MSSGQSNIATHLVSVGMIAAGAMVCVFLGGRVAQDPDLKTPLNPFGINTSPFGEVIAMAMQEPVDTYWNNASDTTAKRTSPPPPAVGFRNQMRGFLEDLEAASVERTNPHHTGKALSFHLRREIEKKLKFAYNLDPGHYGNFNSYHFFLTEPAVGTRRQLTNEAIALADHTIRYCLSRRDDPRYALTAAAATENVLQLMFNDRHNPKPQFTTAQMRQQVAMLDHCLTRYDELAAEWERTGNWKLLSEQRVAEAVERRDFILQMRKVVIKTIERLEAEEAAPPTSFIQPPSLHQS